ncbi:MAG: hypothetical protein JNL57_06125 [Bacteroidetes bacterium]|nr:hypothetical protein [Bacteroidota bacterium]
MDNKKYLVLTINPSQYNIIDKQNRYFTRKSFNNQYVIKSSAELEVEFIEKNNSTEYAKTIIRDATLSDLNIELIDNQLKANNLGLYNNAIDFLQKLNLIVAKDERTFKITKAALLLFAKDISNWHPRSNVRIVKFTSGNTTPIATEYRASEDTTIERNIVELWLASWFAFRRYIVEDRWSGHDLKFRSTFFYPEYACAEALLNAIAHRDYTIEGAGIEIKIFEDKLEVISPGGLLNTISIEDIRNGTGVHVSRNPLISRTLREFGYMRELGEGIQRIIKEFEMNDLKSPEFNTSNSNFTVTLYNKLIYTEDEKNFINLYDQIPNLTLNKHEKAVLRLGIHGKTLSKNQIHDALNSRSNDTFNFILNSLISKNLLVVLYKPQVARSEALKQNIELDNLPRYKITHPKNILSNQDSELNKSIFVKVKDKAINAEEIISIIKNKHKLNIKVVKNSENTDFWYLILEFDSAESAEIVLLDKSIFESFSDKITISKNKQKYKNQEKYSSSLNSENYAYKKSNPNERLTYPSKHTRNWRDGIRNWEAAVNQTVLPDNFTQKTIIVKNIPAYGQINQNDLVLYFRQYGKIEDIVYNENKNLAFITFENPKSAFYIHSRLSNKLKLLDCELIIILKADDPIETFTETINNLAEQLKKNPDEKYIDKKCFEFIKQYHQQFECGFLFGRYLKYSSNRFSIRNFVLIWLEKYQNHPAASLVLGRWLTYFVIYNGNSMTKIECFEEIKPYVANWINSNNHLEAAIRLNSEFIQAGGSSLLK